MQCKLCLQEKPLIKKSHIIPKKFFQQAFINIPKGFAPENYGDKAYRLYSKESKSRNQPSGIHVKNILCESCEQKLGLFDNYAQTILLNNDKYLKKDDKKNVWKLQNIDYDYIKLKLFFMSVLWRSQICSDSFCSQVELTSDSEAKLRDMIINKNPGSENEFSVLLLKYLGEEAESFSVARGKQLCEVYMFRLGNYTFYIKVDENSWPDLFQEYMLKPEQNLLIPDGGFYKETKSYQSDVDNIDKYKA